MKTSLKLSISLNLLLLAGVMFLGWHETETEMPVATVQSLASTRSNVPVITNPVPAVLSITSVTPVAFHWKQLDAADYHDYVKNLRGIGCPEATLRAIVTADVHAAFSLRAKALEKKLSDLADGSWSTRTLSTAQEAALKDELQQMPVAETAEIADLLGLKTATDALAVASKAGEADDEPADQTPATLPLIFQNLDPVALGLDDEQLQSVNKLRQDFVNQVGGTNQDPQDPTYLARWQQAQPAADAMLRGTLGTEVYSKYLLMQVAAQNSAPATP